MAKCFYACVIDVHQLAAIVRNRIDNVLILDSRSFLEYNVSHVMNAVNVGCAKLMKRRLQQDKLSIQDFLAHSCHWNVETDVDIIVYDQSTEDPSCLNPDSFIYVFLHKLLPVYKTVNVLKGGFLEFQASYPNLCEDDKAKYTPLTSLSQPCLPISDHGPTRILSFLYLGSQHDALNKEVLLNHNITYELNVSTNCPKPDFIQEAHFMRIPVIDNYSEKLLPYFPKAFQFLDKVRESGGCALVHCLAGISRSATVAIAYVMRHLKMSSDEAYRFVKGKRATISPNFNFLGQLLEYEKQLQRENILKTRPSVQCQKIPSPKDACTRGKYEKDFPLSYGNENNDHKLGTERFLLEVPSFNCVKPRDFSKTCLNGSKSTNSHSNLNKQDMDFCSSNVSGKNLTIKKCKEIKADEWSLKCLPFSSLKQLNFTPCQTAISKNTDDHIREFNSWSAGDTYTQACVYTQVPDSNNLLGKKSDPSFDLAVFENILSECKMETFNSISSLPSSMWQVSDSAQSQIQQSEYDDKEYKRSDSTSTSGLGSEGSDFMDSWNEYHSSCDRDTDMDEDYSSVPTEDEYPRNRSGDLYGETSLYGKLSGSEFDKDVKRSLSPFKAPFFADYSQENESEHCSSDSIQESFLNNQHSTAENNILKKSLNSQACIKSTKFKKSSDGLYRAQSCPGIISDEPMPCSSSLATKQANFSIVKRVRNQESTKASKNRNRYSCSSLDYIDYPNVSFHSSTTESVSALSPPHQLYRHSMIQVS